MDEQITRLNYSAHAVDDLKAMGNWYQKNGTRAQVESLPVLGGVISILRNAEKFLLPHDCELLSFNEVSEKYRDLIRLPYPAVALEFSTSPHRNGGSSRGIVLAWHGQNNLPPERLEEFDIDERAEVIAFTSFFYSDGQKTWMPSPHVFWFHRDHLDIHMGGIRAGIGNALAYGDMHLKTMSAMSDEQHQRELDGNLKVSMDAILEFLVTVNCENVIQDSLTPSNVLNQKRKSRQKEPFYSYRVLSIPGGNNSGPSLGGNHASPRMHLRRGHLRRLNTGKVTWVRHTIVGNAELGVADKNYRVTA